MRYYNIVVKWTCDHCGLVQDNSNAAMARNFGYIEQEIEYPPDGWWTRDNKHYHSKECFVAAMSPEELELYEKAVWVM